MDVTHIQGSVIHAFARSKPNRIIVKPVSQPDPADAFVRFGTAAKPHPFVIDNPPPLTSQNMGYYEKLIQTAASFSQPGVSRYKVGEVIIGESGKAYLATNLEFNGGTYADTVHGEQFAFALMRQNGEKGVKALVVSAEPCGHCRQFMLEGGNRNFPIVYKNSQDGTWKTTTLNELLPGPFTLANGDENMFRHKPHQLELVGLSPRNALTRKALEAAKHSYTPLTENTWAGVAVKLKNGKIYTGNPIESSAFNPTLPPLQSALISMVADHQPFSHIDKVVLVEPEKPDFSYAGVTRKILKEIAPNARLVVRKAREVKDQAGSKSS